MPLYPPVNPAQLSELYRAPAGALAQTFPRFMTTNSPGAPGSGTISLGAILLPVGTVVTNITFVTNGAAKTGGTHGWYVLCDSARKVQAVTADQTDAATVWGATNTAYPLAVGTPYAATYTGLFYVGVMVAETAGTMPTFDAYNGMQSGTGALAPALAGTSNTAQTTPPALGTTLNAIANTANSPYYAYIT